MRRKIPTTARKIVFFISTKNINIIAYLLLYTCISIRDYEIYENNNDMSKTTILQIYCYDYDLHPGWVEKIAQTLHDGLYKNKNIDILDVTSDIGQGSIKKKSRHIYLPSRDLVPGFPVPKIRSSLFRSRMANIKTYKPDIIQTHTRFFLYTLIGGILAKLWWSKWIHIEHGSGFVTGYPWYIKLCARLFDWTIGLRVFRQADQIVTISHAHGQFIQKFTHKLPIVVYNPIEYVSPEKTKNTIPHIWFVGRLAPIKWVDILLAALTRLVDITRHCTIVGDGPERENLETLAVGLWLHKRIRFVWQDDRSHRLHKFDIFINPSLQEWLPTTVVEALLSKCLVVATDVGGTREVSDEDDLLIVKSKNIQDLASGIRTALAKTANSGDSYKSVQEKFSVQKAIDTYCRLYDTMLGR